MDKSFVLNGNKFIAEFMNLEVVDCNIGTSNGVVNKGYITPHFSTPSTLDGMQYKYKWDWLMPVVEKIQHLDNEYKVDVKFEIEMMGAVELWINHKRYFAQTAFEEGTLIDAVYKAVVEFIKWYNEQN